MLIAANADSVFARLCDAMGHPELLGDPRFREHSARGRHMKELDDIISEWTCTREADAVLELLSTHSVPAGRVDTAPDMLSDPHYLARDMVVRAAARAGYDVPMLGVVPKFSRTPGGVSDVGPLLGEHTEPVLRALAGVEDAEWSALVAGGTVA